MRAAAAALAALAAPGCAAVQLAGDVAQLGENVAEAAGTTSDSADVFDRNERLQLYYGQRAAGDLDGALETISVEIADDVEPEHRFYSTVRNGEMRALGLDTLIALAEAGGCDPGHPDLAETWRMEGVEFTAINAVQMMKQIELAKRDFDAAWASNCA